MLSAGVELLTMELTGVFSVTSSGMFSFVLQATTDQVAEVGEGLCMANLLEYSCDFFDGKGSVKNVGAFSVMGVITSLLNESGESNSFFETVSFTIATEEESLEEVNDFITNEEF